MSSLFLDPPKTHLQLGASDLVFHRMQKSFSTIQFAAAPHKRAKNGVYFSWIFKHLGVVLASQTVPSLTSLGIRHAFTIHSTNIQID